MKLKLLLSLLLLPVLAFVVFKAINLGDIRNLLVTFPWEYLLGLFGLTCAISTIKAFRFYLLLRNNHVPVTFFQTWKAFIAGQAISPFPGGEFARGYFLKRETGKDLEHTNGPIVTQTYFELFSATIIALIGSLYYPNFMIPSLIALIVLLVIGIVLTSRRLMRWLIAHVNKLQRYKQKCALFIEQYVGKYKKLRWLRENHSQKTSYSARALQRGVRRHFIDEDTKLPDKMLIRGLGLSVLAHLVGGVIIFLVAHYYGATVGILLALFAYAAGIAIQSIASITPGGIGFTEGGMTGVLSLSGVEFSQALAIVLVFRFVTFFLSVALGFVFIALIYAPITQQVNRLKGVVKVYVK